MNESFYAPGTKVYQKEEGKDPDIKRVISYKNDSKQYKVKDLATKKVLMMDKEEVEREWTRLNPDALIMLYTAIFDGLEDVLICVHKRVDRQFERTPHIVCRQNVVDMYRMSNNVSIFQPCIGMCLSRNAVLENLRFEDFLRYDDELTSHTATVVYIDDTFNDIIEFMDTRKADKVLRNNKEGYWHKYEEAEMYGLRVIGVCSTVEELLKTNAFMFDYHAIMDIAEVPFSLRDPDKIPRKALVDVITHITRTVPEEIYVLKYDKSINISQFKRKYILMTADPEKCDPDDTDIYIVCYDESIMMSYVEYVYGSREGMKDKLRELGWEI